MRVYVVKFKGGEKILHFKPLTSHKGVDLKKEDKATVSRFVKTVDYTWSGWREVKGEL